MQNYLASDSCYFEIVNLIIQIKHKHIREQQHLLNHF